MKSESGVLIGICRPVPDVLGFVTPVFRDCGGNSVAQIVEHGRIVRFAPVDLGEEFVPLQSCASVRVGEPAFYGMELQDCIAVGSPRSELLHRSEGASDWSDENAIKAALAASLHANSGGVLRFPRPGTHGRKLAMRLAAAVAFLCLGVALGFAALVYIESDEGVATAGWQVMELHDGSVLRVGPRSKVDVKYTDAARIAHLIEGTAQFDVARDPERPFIARTAWVDATAVGTKFAVSVDDVDSMGPVVVVTVSEGTVSVVRRGRADGAEKLVNAGQTLRMYGAFGSPHMQRVETDRRQERATTHLNLGGLTVAEAVAQLNSHNRVQIIVNSPTLGTRIVEDPVIVGSPEDYADLVVRKLGAQATMDLKNHSIQLSE